MNALRRKMITGSFGIPVDYYRLLQAADVGYIYALEVGGKGALTKDGWVSKAELIEMAEANLES